MSGFIQIDGSLIMAGSPDHTMLAYWELEAKNAGELSQLRLIAGLNPHTQLADWPNRHYIIETCIHALRFAESGDWGTAMKAFLYPLPAQVGKVTMLCGRTGHILSIGGHLKIELSPRSEHAPAPSRSQLWNTGFRSLILHED